MYEIETDELAEQPVAVIRSRVEEDAIGSWFAAAYGQLATHLQGIRIATVGLPFARCARDATGFDVEAGLPVSEPIEADGEIQPATLPGGSVAVTWHEGSWATAEPAYAAIAEWLQERHWKPDGRPWEIYHSDLDADLDEHRWRTQVIQPYTA